MNKPKTGRIIIGSHVTGIFPWEIDSAKALCDAGYVVEFAPRHNSSHSADAYINGTLYEFKSPEGSKISCINNNLNAALKFQSKYVVIDTARVKNLRDENVKRFLISRVHQKRGMKGLILITKNRDVFDLFKILK